MIIDSNDNHFIIIDLTNNGLYYFDFPFPNRLIDVVF